MSLGAGWSDLAEELRDGLASLDPPGVLEKIWIDASGLLRFRVKLQKDSRAEGRALVREYEGRAAALCEHCGHAGRARAGMIVTILCDDCVPDR